MTDITALSRVMYDENGEPYVDMSPKLLNQMGWDDHTLLEWEVIGNMAVVRKKDDDEE